MERSMLEIEKQIGLAIDEPNKYPGMTYSEGVLAALNWIIGITDNKPMEED
jgi:hypothetical protein